MKKNDKSNFKNPSSSTQVHIKSELPSPLKLSMPKASDIYSQIINKITQKSKTSFEKLQNKLFSLVNVDQNHSFNNINHQDQKSKSKNINIKIISRIGPQKKNQTKQKQRNSNQKVEKRKKTIESNNSHQKDSKTKGSKTIGNKKQSEGVTAKKDERMGEIQLKRLQLMEQLKKIDEQLSNKEPSSSSFESYTQQKNINTKLTPFNLNLHTNATSKLQEFSSRVTRNVYSSSDHEFTSGIHYFPNHQNSSKSKKAEHLDVQKHSQVLSLLSKINVEKLERQEKVVQKIKEKQNHQMKKLLEIQKERKKEDQIRRAKMEEKMARSRMQKSKLSKIDEINTNNIAIFNTKINTELHNLQPVNSISPLNESDVRNQSYIYQNDEENLPQNSNKNEKQITNPKQISQANDKNQRKEEDFVDQIEPPSNQETINANQFENLSNEEEETLEQKQQ